MNRELEENVTVIALSESSLAQTLDRCHNRTLHCPGREAAVGATYTDDARDCAPQFPTCAIVIHSPESDLARLPAPTAPKT